MKAFVRRVLATLFMAVLAAAAAADEQADRLKLRALVEEADLILDEAAALQPALDALAREGDSLDAAERSLRAESAELNQEIAALNAEVQQFDRAVAEQRTRCPKQSEDKALVEGCNAEAAQLSAAAQRLDAKRNALRARQAGFNQRIAQHNAARRDWALRKREVEPKARANGNDADHWLAEARPFLASDAFRALREHAGDPPVCKLDSGQSAAVHALAMRAPQACLKAVAAAL